MRRRQFGAVDSQLVSSLRRRLTTGEARVVHRRPPHLFDHGYPNQLLRALQGLLVSLLICTGTLSARCLSAEPPARSPPLARLFACLTPASTRLFSIGTALTDSLDDLIQTGQITPQLAMRVLVQVRPAYLGRCCWPPVFACPKPDRPTVLPSIVSVRQIVCGDHLQVG